MRENISLKIKSFKNYDSSMQNGIKSSAFTFRCRGLARSKMNKNIIHEAMFSLLLHTKIKQAALYYKYLSSIQRAKDNQADRTSDIWLSRVVSLKSLNCAEEQHARGMSALQYLMASTKLLHPLAQVQSRCSPICSKATPCPPCSQL